MSSNAPDQDEQCQVCGEIRENHGDKNHKFSTDGQLLPLDPPKPASREAPRHRDDVVAEAIKAESFAMLLEVLAEKNILNEKDIIRILMPGTS